MNNLNSEEKAKKRSDTILLNWIVDNLIEELKLVDSKISKNNSKVFKELINKMLVESQAIRGCMSDIDIYHQIKTVILKAQSLAVQVIHTVEKLEKDMKDKEKGNGHLN